MKKTKPLSTIVNYFVVIFFLANSSVNAKEYIIGVEDVSYYPFYDFSAKELNRKSFTKELLSTFFRHQGYQFKFVALPLKRFDKWYIEEAIDFKFPDNIRWRSGESKNLNLTYSEPVLHLTAGTYVLKKNSDMPRQKIKTLGTILGFFPTLWYDRLQNKTIELVEVSSPYSLIKHLLHGNVEAINIDKNIIDYNLKLLQEEGDAIVLNKHINYERYAYHFSTIYHPKIIQEFNCFLSAHSQLVAEIKRKYAIIETPESL
tara:strand:+ start:731 stop:1507 length:777 start_codon:yes stop_codon:yes gene_type:complete